MTDYASFQETYCPDDEKMAAIVRELDELHSVLESHWQMLDSILALHGVILALLFSL